MLPTGVGCANALCVTGPTDPPRDHDACAPDGRILHCLPNGGADNVRACAAGTVCQSDGVTAVCAPPGTVGPRDAGADVPRDVGVDVPRDVGVDVPRDVGVDVPRDVGAPDIGRDVGVDDVATADAGRAGLVEGGCGCRTAVARGSARWLAVAVMAAMFGRRRRRRASRAAGPSGTVPSKE